MKKALFTLLTLCILAPSLKSQERKHEIKVGYGIISTCQILDLYSDVFSSIFSTLTNDNFESSKYTGAIHAGYKYALTNRLHIGGTFVYDHSSANDYDKKEKTGKYYRDYYTLAVEGDIKYLNTKYVSLYGTIGVGGTLYKGTYKPVDGRKKSDNTILFNYQITPLGIKLGNRFGFLAELGFGYKGIFSAGTFARF